jgi:hypothetical protein
MNFVELCKLHAQHGTDRQVIADAMHMTVDEIDRLQLEAARIANELKPNNILPPMTGAG